MAVQERERAVVAVFPRTVPERLKAMKSQQEGLSLVWIVLAGLAIVAVAIWAWRRRCRRDQQIDRQVLTARARERGFSARERELIHHLADLGTSEYASDLVPRLRAYDEALATYLREESGAPSSEEDREALAGLLSSVRSKLGFERLPEHRLIPSTREIPMGTELSVRRADSPEAMFHPAIAQLVNDLDFRIRFVQESADERDPGPEPPSLREGQSVEVVFAHGIRRCRFFSRVVGAPRGEGPVVPLGHARVESFALSRSRRSEIRIEARLEVPDRPRMDVVILELTGSSVQLSSVLPDLVPRGILVFRVPGDCADCIVDVSSPEPEGVIATPAERSQLRFRRVSEEARQRILQFVRGPVPTAT